MHVRNLVHITSTGRGCVELRNVTYAKPQRNSVSFFVLALQNVQKRRGCCRREAEKCACARLLDLSLFSFSHYENNKRNGCGRLTDDKYTLLASALISDSFFVLRLMRSNKNTQGTYGWCWLSFPSFMLEKMEQNKSRTRNVISGCFMVRTRRT